MLAECESINLFLEAQNEAQTGLLSLIISPKRLPPLLDGKKQQNCHLVSMKTASQEDALWTERNNVKVVNYLLSLRVPLFVYRDERCSCFANMKKLLG